VFCRLRYMLTLHDISEIILLRRVTVSHECIRQREAKLLPVVGEALRKRRHGRDRSSGQGMPMKFTPRDFEVRVRELMEGHAMLLIVAGAMLRARAVLAEQFGKLQKRLASLARQDTRGRLLLSTPAVGEAAT
jgi:hypothetical protein